jgi:hypothetical protein
MKHSNSVSYALAAVQGPLEIWLMNNAEQEAEVFTYGKQAHRRLS